MSFPTGWLRNPDAVAKTLATMPFPYFASAAPGLSGSGEGKTALLYKEWKDVDYHVPGSGNYEFVPGVTSGSSYPPQASSSSYA